MAAPVCSSKRKPYNAETAVILKIKYPIYQAIPIFKHKLFNDHLPPFPLLKILATPLVWPLGAPRASLFSGVFLSSSL